jgi:putative copper export protein/methionine-rich copper-binding protein CopC
MKRLRTRWTWALAAALMGALTVLVGPAQVANAHAALTTTTPTQGSVIPNTPDEIVLTFNEPVALVPGRTQVIAPDGKRINVGDPRTSGLRLTIDVRVPDRPLGTYVVSYRVISADSHAISGAFAFSVGAPSAPPEVQEVAVRPEVRAAVPVAKYLGYVGLTLTVGPLLLLLTLWPRRLSRRGVLRLVWTGVGLLAAGTLASLWLQAPYASGAGAFDVSLTELRQVATSQYGVTLLVRLALIAVAVLLARHILRTRKARTAKIALGSVVVGGLVTWPLAGHQIASPAPPIMAGADVAHLASMSVWLGGLAVLAGFLLRRADPRELRIILPVWSRWAAAAVYWLVAAGVVQTVVQVDTPAHLLTTDYGRLIVAKVALVAGVLGVAFFSRRMVRRAAGTPVAPLRGRGGRRDPGRQFRPDPGHAGADGRRRGGRRGQGQGVRHHAHQQPVRRTIRGVPGRGRRVQHHPRLGLHARRPAAGCRRVEGDPRPAQRRDRAHGQPDRHPRRQPGPRQPHLPGAGRLAAQPDDPYVRDRSGDGDHHHPGQVRRAAGLRDVEVAVLGAADEGGPLEVREHQHRTGAILAVPDRDLGVQDRDLDAVVAAVAVAAAPLLPGRAVELKS